jgi:hypothetical protein
MEILVSKAGTVNGIVLLIVVVYRYFMHYTPTLLDAV